MAKARMNVFTEISGSVGEDLTFRRLSMQNKQLLQTKPVPRYTRTTAQNAVRNGYKQACNIWKTASWLDKSVYTDLSKIYNITDFNTFLKLNLPALTKAPALYFGLDEGTGTVAHDYSPNGNDGTIYGATWKTLATGKHVLYGDGINDYVIISNTASLNPANTPFTAMCWFKPETTEGVVLERGGSYLGYVIYVYGGLIKGAMTNVGIRYIVNSNVNAEDTYYNAALVIKQAEIELWLNGKLKGTTATGTLIQYEPADYMQLFTSLGTAVGETQAYMKGEIGSVALFREALTETQIKRIYETTRDLFKE